MKMDHEKRLFVSFSGGRSSAVMVKLCLDEFADHEIVILFANTGCEHESTLEFVDAVDRNFANGQIIWVEAVTNGYREGMSARHGTVPLCGWRRQSPPHAIKKYGVFNRAFPNCTGRTKTEPMHWFIQNVVGWEKGSYETAVGIRADESDRISSKRKENRIVYPLVDKLITKKQVNTFMGQYSWDLKIPNDAWGNCVWCWKKSLRKLLTVAKHDPRAFDFPAAMEHQFGWVNPGGKDMENPRVFFRGKRSASQIIELANTVDFVEYKDTESHQLELFDSVLDVGGGCGDSCEIGADDD